jgi:hypothetical protein
MRLACWISAITISVSVGCQSTPHLPGTITLERWTPNGMALELQVSENSARVCPTTVTWPEGLPSRTFLLPTDTERFRLLWQRLRQWSFPTPDELGPWLIILEKNGSRVAELAFDDDAERLPLWYGVMRELQACARADFAYALAYREIAEHYASQGEWRRASRYCLWALDAGLAARQFELAVLLRGRPGEVIIDDASLFTTDPRSFEASGYHEEAVEAFRETWDEWIAPWISVMERDGVIEVTVHGQVPRYPAGQSPVKACE